MLRAPMDLVAGMHPLDAQLNLDWLPVLKDRATDRSTIETVAA